MAQEQDVLIQLKSEQIYVNLHKSAQQEAAKKIGIQSTSRTINQFIINTIYSDGSIIRNDPYDDISFDEPGKTKVMEMAIVMQVKELQNLYDQSLTEDEHELKKQKNDNSNLLKKTKKTILSGINEYFKWFSGNDNAFNDTDLELFIPRSSNGAVVSKINGENYELVGIDEKDEYMSLFDPSQSKHPSKEMAEKLIQSVGQVPVIGYKVKYSIS